MICLGFDAKEKDACVAQYVAEYDISKVVILSPEKFKPALFVEHAELVHDYVEYAQIIEYKPFYRLLQEIDRSTLIVVNECLRTQKRGDLTYNCMRHFLNQTEHQIVFQYLPIIDTIEDFMTLLDFDTQSRWKRLGFDRSLLADVRMQVRPVAPKLAEVSVEVGDKVRCAYDKEKRRLIDSIGLKDPHTIPRNLYLMSGKAKLGLVDLERRYVGRNNRFGLANMTTYKELSYPYEYAIFEFCHNSIDFTDFLALSKRSSFDVLVSDLKVDRWYFDRYRSWAGRLADAYAALQ